MSSKNAALTDSASLSLKKVVAGPVMLWGLAVSAAIVGDFSGWNTGLLQGGFGGMLVATLIALVLQVFLSMTVAELAAAMPFAGGAAVYARVGFGRWAGLATGAAMLIEYVCAMASIMLIIGHQLNATFSLMAGLTVSEPMIWLGLIVIFSLLNLSGNGTFFRMAVVLTIAPLAALFIYAVSVSKTFSLDRLLDVPTIPGGTDWLPFGLIGIAFALPFAIWLFLAVDVVTLAAEDTRNPGRDLPKSLIWAMVTLAVSSIVVLVVASGTVPGALTIGGAAEPLLLGLQDVFGDRAVLYLFVVLGSVASFHSTIYAGARILFSLSRAGYLFDGLSKFSPRTGIPNRAVIGVAGLTFAIGCVTLYLPNDLNIVDILVHMAVLGALLSYFSAFCSYLVIHAKHRRMERPFLSPFGPTGAIAGLIISVSALLLMFTNPIYFSSLTGCVLVFVAMLVIDLVFAKRHLGLKAPEEQFVASLTGTEAQQA